VRSIDGNFGGAATFVIENVFVGFGGLPFNLHNQSILDLRPTWVYQDSDKSLLDFTGLTHTLSVGCALLLARQTGIPLVYGMWPYQLKQQESRTLPVLR
jgi:hypothetical protein